MGELFTKLERAAWGGFVVAQGRLFQRIEDDLRRKFGITHAELEVLLRLAFEGNGRARIQDLSARSLLSRSGTSRAVDRLVRAGYVDRVGAEEDGRGAYAVLTTRGRTHFLAAAKAHVALVRRDFLSHFSADEQETLAGFWRRIADGTTPTEHTAPADPEPPRPRAARRRPRAKATSR
ncbi:MAG: MarR family transcriptional regulator [Polyangiaceae bacterium]|jgi:DNA-binding MarR family transcriptional regulator